MVPAKSTARDAAARKRRTEGELAAPAGPRIALHDEMIAGHGPRRPMTAAELAEAIVERGSLPPPRSGKPLDAAMVSQRVSNPTYRSRFVRNEGRIGLAEGSVAHPRAPPGGQSSRMKVTMMLAWNSMGRRDRR